jgi:hypothetical protein
MTQLACTARGRLLLIVATLMLWASIGSTAFAATGTSFRSSFAERTTFLACPPEYPAGSTCFRGEGTGTAKPPGVPAKHAFTGDVATAPTPKCPEGLTSHSKATIYTSQGSLDLIASGTQCPPLPGETGTWQAVGGTGYYAGAVGGGTYATTNVVLNKDGTVSSTTTYNGSLSLRGR